MCYENEMQHKGLKFIISDCFGIGFDWNDPEFIKAVNQKDARINEILEWAASGGAKTYNDAASFSSNMYSNSISSNLNMLQHYEIKELIELQNNPYASAKTLKVISSFFDGTLAEAAREERAERKNSKNRNVKPGSVYLLQLENGMCKIGKAVSIEKRLIPFSVHFPMKWELLHSFKSEDYSRAEEILHKKFSDKREIGEFFRLSDEDIMYIKSITDGAL